MCTHRQANIEQNLDGNSLVRPSTFRRTVAWLTLAAYVGQPLIVTAQVVADQTAAPNKRPVVDTTASGIPLVQIAAPSAAGVSHNQYTQFNVDSSGVILNNSQITVPTQQAGYVASNPNLVNGSARVILNEVNSTSRSQLNGYTEVAGQQAEVIIANPNGITCNGCGFINTSRSVLTTGAPVIGAGGSLDAFRVTGGDIQIGSSGLNAGNISQLDLIARSVQVNGQIWASNLNVITGANLVDYNTLGIQFIQGTGARPTVGIDVALLGGMYANKISLIGTEAGVGVNSLGNLSAQAGDFTLDYQGQIILDGRTTASGNVSINSNTGITNSGVLYSQLDSQLSSTGNINNTGLLLAQGNLTLNAASLTSTGNLGAGIDTSGSATQNGNLTINTQGQTTANGTNLAGSNLNITASSINLAGSQTSAWSGIDLHATAGNIDNSNGSLITMQGLAKLNSTGSLINGSGQIGSGQDISVTAITLNGNGHIVAGRDAYINLQGNYTNAAGNVIQANRDLIFGTTGTLTNQAALEAVGNLTANVAGIDNQAGAQINSAHTTLNIGTGDITNAGRIEGNIVDTYSNNINNTATVIGNVVSINANSISNQNATAIIAATQSVNLIVANALVNQNGANIFSLGDINIGSNNDIDPTTGLLTGNAASVTNRSAAIEATNDLRISAVTITNDRATVGLTWGTSWAGTPIVNTAVQGGPNVNSYTVTYANQQFTAATTPAAQLLSGVNMYLGGGILNNNYSSIIAGGALSTQMVVNNYGAAFLQSTTLSGTTDIWVATYHPQSGSCGFISVNCVHAYTSWALVTTPYNPPTTYIPISGSNYTKLELSPSAYLAAKGNESVATNAISNTPLNLSASTISLPSNGFYTIHTQPNQTYLVATDPRFTSYQTFVSSDYMLSRMSLDPQLMEKRLGDGFYEQKLVLDQISGQTGHRYLGQYANANDQYIALLDAGVNAAKELKLVAGVALTAGQIASLASDMVWLIDQIVVLPNGSTQHVLAPKVYLSRLHDGDLKPSGSLIAADVIDIRSNGALENSGTIEAGSHLSIQTQDITNRGGTLGGSGDTFLRASNDILNQSGNINGHRVALLAGRDIISERMTDAIVLGGLNLPQPMNAGPQVNSTSTVVYGMAGINATGGMDITAGRDITLAASKINSGGDTTLNAGQDLNVRTVSATDSSVASQYGSYRNNVTQLTSGITTGGNLTLVSGKDMHLTSVALDIGKDATLVAGGDLTFDASKNSSSFSYNTSSAKGRFNDETVLGSILNVGGNVTLVATQSNDSTTQASSGGISAGRTDDKGNITLTSTAIASKTGNLTVVADANVNIGVTEENHNSYTESHATGSGMFTHTTLDVRNESWRTDNVGSNLSGNNINLTSGRDINVTGSSARAEHDINAAAMGEVNISAATATYGSDHYSHETTTGLQFSSSNVFSLTDSGLDITNMAHTDGTIQRFNRSSLTSTSGNLNILSGGNLIASGTDFAANAGDLALTAGGTVALIAGQDTLKQSSSTVIVTNPNFFTKQRHTITDTSASFDYQGSIAQGKSIKVSSGADIILQVAQITSGEGGINLDAGGDIKLLTAINQGSHTHTEKLSTDGIGIKADGTPDDTATRRINNKDEGQTSTALVTGLISTGNITTHSGGDTMIEASTLNAKGSIDLSATGYAATYNEDGSIKTEGRDGKITFAAAKDSTYTSASNSSSSMPWQAASGNGSYTETLKLANISAGKGLSVNATGGVVVDIPEVPVPAPATQSNSNTASNANNTQQMAEEVAAQKNVEDELRFNNHIQNLASKPGQEWIGQLAQMAKDKPDSVKLQQVNAAVQHWDYAHEGLTGEAAAVIAIVVAYFTAGAASSAMSSAAGAGGAAGGTAGAAAGTATSATVSTWAVGGLANTVVTAGLATLASKASVSFINNKGNIGKTLDDMGKSENVKAVVAAILTAGVMQSLGSQQWVQDLRVNSTAPFSATSFATRLELNLTNTTISTGINSVVYGTSFTDAMQHNLQNAGVDTFSSFAANGIGASYKTDGGLLNDQYLMHKLAHAALGCASASAKGDDCASGALGGVSGEVFAQIIGGSTDGSQLTAEQQGKVVFLTQLATAGAAIVTDSDLNTALATSQNAVVNNYLSHQENQDRLEAARGCAKGNQEACDIRDALNALDKARDEVLNLACQGDSSNAACTGATIDMRNSLSTYFQTINGVQLKNDALSIAEQNAGLGDYTAKKELQSFADLLKVSNQEMLTVQSIGQPAKLPDKYNSDPYGVMNPENPKNYMVVKVGNQWGAVGQSDKVYTSVASVNGMGNKTDYAPGLMGYHVEKEKEFKTSSLYTLYYNPTEGFQSDAWEVFNDKLGFTTPITQQFSNVLSDVQDGDRTVTWVVHSQGGEIFSEAVRYNGGDLSKNNVIFHAGANNQLVTNHYLQNAGINSGKKTQYWDSPWDLVPNIIGLNTLNPIKITGSILASPQVIWGDPSSSPHTLPYNPAPPIARSQGMKP